MLGVGNMRRAADDAKRGIAEALQALEEVDRDREVILKLCREIIRLARVVVAKTHSNSDSSNDLDRLREIVAEIKKFAIARPEVFYTGTVTSALSEYAEAACLFFLVHQGRIPSFRELGIDPAPYVLGLADLVGEARRRILDCLRKRSFDEAEDLFEVMEAIYDALRVSHLPDALAPGLRRKTDIARSLVENTRRDIIFYRRSVELEKALDLWVKASCEKSSHSSVDNR